MGLLDDRGRLFGRINIIDIVVIVIVIAVLLGTGYKLLKTRTAAPAETVRFEVLAPTVMPEAAAEIHPGDQLVAGNNLMPDKITSVVVIPAMLGVSRADGTRARVPDPYLKDVVVWVQGQAPVSGGTITMAGQQIRAGANFVLKTRLFDAEKGTILTVQVGNP
ncbi:MAG TPA: DUF4330 domain-containing protein [Spirochaetia bacterium]|nr:DUF4330 domain-containing protein [Spirochaetia bacterium]